MNDQPSKWLTATWTTLATLAGALVMFGQNYAGWAAANPDQSAWLGWSATGIGAITGVAGIVVAVIDKMKAANAAPTPPAGSDLGATDHLISMAISQALKDGQHDKAEKLLGVIKPQTGSKP